MLAAGALVASLLAVGASPAGATEDKADYTTDADSCVGPADADQMFTDVSDMHTFKDAINCIAYYGITNGTGDGSTYSPNDNVSRWQMALFITRAAGPAGLKLAAAADQGFADIGDAPAGAHDAINQLAAAGIMAGKSKTMYDPNGMVSRADMAVILVNFLAQASANVKIDKAGKVKLGATGTGDADDWFPDARAKVPAAADDRISAAYELGITTGTTKAPKRAEGQTYAGLLTSFDPLGLVNRGEMAAFITRALNHTNARPAGVTVYRDSSNGSYKASVRNADLTPVSGARVDLFYGLTAKAGQAFNQYGTCNLTVVKSKTGTTCAIDRVDPVTNSSGNVTLAGPTTTGNNAEHTKKTLQTVWVWTGGVGTIVTSVTGPFRLDLEPPKTPNLVATRTLVSDDKGGQTLFRYDDDRTITLQLQNVNTTPDPDVVTNTSSGTTVGKSANWTYIWRLCSDDPESSGTCSNLIDQKSGVLKSDSGGQATITVSAPSDPTPGVLYTGTGDSRTQTVDNRWVSVVLTPKTGQTTGNYAPDSDSTVNAAGTSTTVFEYAFSDAVNVATANKGSIKHQAPYVALPGTDSGGTRGSQLVTVTVNDQYGSPMAGQTVNLGPSDNVTVSGGPYSTDGNGEAVIVYTLGGSAASGWGAFTLNATVGSSDSPTTVATGNVYFVRENVATQSQTVIDYIDVANKAIVADNSDNNTVAVYDSGDQFVIGTTPSTMEAFEKALTEESMKPTTINDQIAWSNYPTDPTKRSTTTTRFTLTVN